MFSRPFDRIHILFLELKRLAQHFDHRNTHCGRDFETHTESESPLAQCLFDRLQEVFGFILFDFDIGIARDAEGLAFQDGAARKQRSDVCRYEMVEQNELAGFVNTDQPRHITRNLYAGKARLLFRRNAARPQQDAKIQTDVRNIRKRMPRIDRKGRQNGKTRSTKNCSRVASSSERQIRQFHQLDPQILKAGRISLNRQSV